MDLKKFKDYFAYSGEIPFPARDAGRLQDDRFRYKDEAINSIAGSWWKYGYNRSSDVIKISLEEPEQGSWEEDKMIAYASASFALQMALMVKLNVEVIVFSFKSAVPLADAVREFYSCQNLISPIMLTARGIDRSKYPEKSWYSDNSEHASVFLNDEYLSNLKISVKGMRVAIVDERVDRGQTVRWIFEQISSYGGHVVITPHPRTYYYDKLNICHIDPKNMTSHFKSLMVEAGQKSYEQLPLVSQIIDYFGAEQIADWFNTYYK